MHIGVTVPIIELRADLIGLRDFVQAAEDLGYAHIRMLDHVLGADPKFHPEVSDLNLLPVQRPIPIWIGAGLPASPLLSDATLRRIGRLADGWIPLSAPDAHGREIIEHVHAYAREAGRDPATIGLEGRIAMAGQEPQEWLTQVQAWQEVGATHVSVGTGGGVVKNTLMPCGGSRRSLEGLCRKGYGRGRYGAQGGRSR